MEKLEQIRELLARLGELNDDELDQLRTLVDEVKDDLLADEENDSDDYLNALDEIAAAIDTVNGEVAAREAKAAERKEKVDALRNKIRGEEGDDGGEGEGGETPPAADDGGEGAGKEKEPVAATAKPIETTATPAPTPARRANPAAARRPRTSEPAPTERQLALVASANLPNINMGSDLSEPRQLGKAFVETWRAGIGYQGGRHNVPVAMGRFEYDESRILDDNVGANLEKIAAVTSRAAIRAAGGICAPAPIQYDLPVIGSAARPLRDALPNFGVPRGAVRTLDPPTIDAVAGNTQAGTNVAIWTESNDQNPSSPATKPCTTITCGTDRTTAVDAITQCIKSGNFRDRYFPESIQAWTSLNDVWAARVKEQNLLAKIAAGSTTYTTGTVLGTARDVFAAVQRHLATIQYWWRLDEGTRFRMLAPRWLQENMAVDLSREQPGAPNDRMLVDDAYVNSIFSNMGVNVSWLMEGESTQRFNRPNAGQVEPWPSHVFLYLFIEGTWLYLNGGTLNLGVVRDSTLNGTNDFQMFEEEFEQVHFHGTFSHKLDIDICPNGQTSLPVAVNVCTSGS